MTIASTCIACSVYTVSSMLSPLTREDSCTSRLTTSAPRRFAASSKETRVRVEGSVKRLATVWPARAWLMGGGAPSGRTNCLRPFEQPLDEIAWQVLEGEQVAQRPIGSQL